jgi:uncharacterized protein YfdQ (DUF2303 family)
MADPVIINNPGDIAAAIKAGTDQAQLLPEVKEHKRAVIVPQASKIVHLEREKLVDPRFLTACPTFHDAKAFIDYFESFKTPGSRIFYSQDGSFRAVIDYHERGPGPAHGDHQAVLVLKRSPEWLTWAAKSDSAMSQQEFAEFIEDNARDILTPGPAEMLEIATGLNATIGATFRSAINQSNGTVQLQYDEEVQGSVKGTARAIPTQFQVALRPFMGTERYPIDCRLRYRVTGGNLRLHYKALHLDPITEAALDGIVARVRDETGVMPALGAHDAEAFKRGT